MVGWQFKMLPYRQAIGEDLLEIRKDIDWPPPHPMAAANFAWDRSGVTSRRQGKTTAKLDIWSMTFLLFSSIIFPFPLIPYRSTVYGDSLPLSIFSLYSTGIRIRETLFKETANLTESRFEKKLNRTSQKRGKALRSHLRARAKTLNFDKQNRIFLISITSLLDRQC